MREIKFRAMLCKIGESPRWVYYTTNEIAYTDDGSWDVVKVKDLQFTGLLDKNGKEIYEGDVVRCANSSMPLLYIRWKDGDSGFCASDATKWFNFMLDGSFALGVEIIGNIYENPELLK